MKISNNSTRERRDWTLLIFIIPVGMILMLIAGQIAIRLVPLWSVNAGMQSSLDPNSLPMQEPVQPLMSSILTPLGWLDTFLTPGSGGYDIISDFVILEPSATSTTAVPTEPTVVESPTIEVTVSSPTIVVTPPVTITDNPTEESTDTPVTPTTPAPTTEVPTATTEDSTAPTEVPTATTVVPTATTAVPTPTTPPPPTPTGTLLTPPILYVSATVPPDLGVDTPPDGTPGVVTAGQYIVVDMSGNPIVVSATSDGNYDLILYEITHPNGGTSIDMDQIIIGVSNSTDGSYYEVFNWGNNVADTNSNVDFNNLPPDTNGSLLCVTAECDNRGIPTSELFPPGTGILIDVDTAQGAPPEGTYNYIVIISPFSLIPDNAQVDSIEVTEVPVPVPIPTP